MKVFDEYKEWEKHFTAKLKELMTEKAVCTKELARRCGITEASMEAYVNGKQVPKGPVIVSIAKALEVTTDSLMSMED